MSPTTSRIPWRDLENPAESAHYCELMESRRPIARLPFILLLALLGGCVTAPPQEGDSAHPYVRDTALFLLYVGAQQLLTSDPTVQSWTPQFGGNMAQWTKTQPGGSTSQCYASGAQQWCTSPPGPGP